MTIPKWTLENGHVPLRRSFLNLYLFLKKCKELKTTFWSRQQNQIPRLGLRYLVTKGQRKWSIVCLLLNMTWPHPPLKINIYSTIVRSLTCDDRNRPSSRLQNDRPLKLESIPLRDDISPVKSTLLGIRVILALCILCVSPFNTITTKPLYEFFLFSSIESYSTFPIPRRHPHLVSPVR